MGLRELENLANYQECIFALCERQDDFSFAALDGEFVFPLWLDKGLTFYNADMILSEHFDYNYPVRGQGAIAEVMRVHGTDILRFILEEQDELPAPDVDVWRAVPEFFLGFAVQLWLTKVESQLVKLLEQNPG